MPTQKIGRAVETNLAMPLARSTTQTIGRATELDTALPITAVGGAVAATAMIGVGLQMMVGPPPPEPGYHLEHGHHDVFGGAIVFGIAVAALHTTVRAYLDARGDV